MSSGQKYEMDPQNAGFMQNEQPQNPYNAGYNQPPPAYGQGQAADYGIPMTNFSTNVDARARFDVGDYEGGRSSASVAKWLTLTSFGIVIVDVIVGILLYAVVLKEAERNCTSESI